MRKFVYVIFALVLALSLSLVTAVSVGANPDGVVFETWEAGTAEWSTTPSGFDGSYCVKMTSPGEGHPGASNFWTNSSVMIPYGENLTTLASIGTQNIIFRLYYPTGSAVPFGLLYLDTTLDGAVDVLLSAKTKTVGHGGPTPDGWRDGLMYNDEWSPVGYDEGTITTPVEVCGTSWEFQQGLEYDLSEWVAEGACWANAIVKYVGFGYACSSNPAYVDDIIIDGTPYEFEWTHVSPIQVDDDRVQYPDAPFQTIQGAIDCAIAGDTIQVYAGEYNEQVYINKANLTVESVAGKATTFIGGTGVTDADLIPGHGALVWLQKDGITLEDFTVRDYPSGWGNGAAVYLQGWNGTTTDDITGCTITANTITAGSDSPANDNGIVVSGGADSNTISDNTITVSGSGGDAIIISGTVGNDTTGNQITGNTIASMKYGVSICTDDFGNQRNFPGTVISGNTISGGTHGIGILYATGTSGSHIVIQENTISAVVTGEEGEGIEVFHGGYVDMFRNTVQNNKTGIQVKNSTNVVANYNSITGNTGGATGFYASGNTPDVDATKNWWGNVAGPEIETNPYDDYNNDPVADAVSDNVNYIPWLIRTTLVANEWNIYSTPIALDSSCDTLAKALAIWGSSHVDPAYYFDSSASPPAWVIPTSLTPLQAIYLHTTAADTIDVWFSTSYTAPPSRVMYQGWNLVGTAELYNRLVDVSLSDALYGTGVATELWGYSKAISPSIHQTYWTYLRDGTKTDKNFVPTNGYWVYVVNQGTLGGFTYTPITELVP